MHHISHKHIHVLVLLSAALLLTGCNGILGGLYDEPPADEVGQGAFTHPSADTRLVRLSLDATSYMEWHYLDLHRLTVETLPIPAEQIPAEQSDGRSGWTYNIVHGHDNTPDGGFPTAPQPEPDAWDLAIHHFDVKTNGASAAETRYTDLSRLPDTESLLGEVVFEEDVWSTTRVITDLSGMMALRVGFQNSYVNEVLCRWMDMDISTPPPIYTPSGRVYLLRLADGSLAALRFVSYMSPAGTKGHLTLDILYPL